MGTTTIEPTEIESPRWQAVGLVLDQNAHDLRTRRYGRLQEVVSWFKGIELFRQAEFARRFRCPDVSIPQLDRGPDLR